MTSPLFSPLCVFIGFECIEFVERLQLGGGEAGALSRPHPHVVVVVGHFGAGSAGTFTSNGQEGAGLGGDDDARDSTEGASCHVSLCKIATLSDGKTQLCLHFISKMT